LFVEANEEIPRGRAMGMWGPKPARRIRARRLGVRAKFVFWLLVCCGHNLSLCADEPHAGRQVAQKLTISLTTGESAKDVDVHYWLFLPAKYRHTEKSAHKWPLVLYLHGAGERGSDLKLVKSNGPSKIVESHHEFPFVVISPQCPANERWNPGLLGALVDGVVAAHDIDPKRLYVTGLSLGGSGTWALLAKYPDKWAAAIPICGGGKPDSAASFKDVPVWAFHCAKDPDVPVHKTTEMIEAMKQAGGKPKITLYPDAKHDAWTATYNDQTVWKWLAEHKLHEKKP
jgi:predicted peptidase